MRKKGFTLIELLATIVIISVVATVTTVVVLDVVEETRKNAFILNVQKVLDTTDYYKAENKVDNLGNTGLNIQTLDLKFKDSYRGRVIEIDGALYSKAITDGVYCANGEKNNLKVVKGDCSILDDTAPELSEDIVSLRETTKSIKVIINTSKIIENESYIKSYQYKIYKKSTDALVQDSGEVEATVDPMYLFDNLERNTEYKIVIIVTNSNNLKNEIEVYGKTKSFEVPEISMEVVNGVESSNGIFTKDKDIITIKYDISPYSEYSYIYEYCISDITTSCNNWQKAEVTDYATDGKYTFKFDVTENNKIVYARMSDGRNESANATLTILNIDKEAPTDLTIKNPTNENWTSKDFSLTLSATDNKKVGIAKYEYSYDNSNWTSYENSDVEDNEEFITPLFSKERNQPVYIRVCDKLDNCSNSSSTYIKIDKTGPTDNNMKTTAVWTDRIGLEALCTDPESGIAKYEFSSDNGATYPVSTVSSTYTFTGLKQNTSYKFKVRCTNGAGLQSIVALTAKTLDIKAPSINTVNTPSTLVNGYTREAVSKITYYSTNVVSPKYYVKSTRNATSNANLNACGSGTMPSDCSNTTTKTITANTWYRLSGAYTMNVTYDQSADSTAVLYAYTYDDAGNNTYSTATIDKIDRVAPSLSLSKITYLTGFDGWTLNKASIDSNGYLVMASSGSNAYNYYMVNGEQWTATFDAYTTATSSQYSSSGQGGVYAQSSYYNSSFTNIKANGGYGTNGYTSNLALNTWQSKSFNGYGSGYGTNVKYVKYYFGTGNTYSQPTLKIRNMKVGGQFYASTYTINVSSSDNVKMGSTIKYAGGNQSVSYFKSSGTSTTGSTVVSANGLYTIYVEDALGNGAVSTINIDKIDKESPVVDIDSATSNSNTIFLEYSMEDYISGIKSYTCKKYDEISRSYTTDGASATSTSCKLTGLTHNKTYSYQVCADDYAGNDSTCVSGSIATKPITNPVISLTKTPSSTQNGYLKKEVATITYSGANISSPEYYLKTTRGEATGSLSGTPCGKGTKPGECSGKETTSYQADTWYKVSGNVTVTYSTAASSTATLYAYTSDGTNYSGSVTATIDKIDTIPPTVTLGTVTSTSKSITIPYTMTDSGSGIYDKTCMYGTSEGKYTTYATWQTSGSTTQCVIPNLTHNETYYYQICSIDRLGNRSCPTGIKATSKIAASTCTITPSGWSQSKVVTCSYPSGYTNQYSTNGGGTWYTYTAPITFTSNKTLIARVTDGTNYVTSSTYTISQIDRTSPTVSITGTSASVNSGTVYFSATDSQSGIGSLTCKYGQYTSTVSSSVSSSQLNYNQNGTISSDKTSCTFTGLSQNKRYYYKICATDNAGNPTVCKTSSFMTSTVKAPTFSVTPSGWAKSKTVAITYQSGYTNQYSVDEGSTWKTYSGAITVTSPTHIIARIVNGSTELQRSSLTVSQIDTTPPTCGDWSGEGTSWTNANRTISVECDDTQSGCVSSSYNVKTYSSGTTSTAALSQVISDKVGNTTTCSKTASVYVDKDKPTISKFTIASSNSNYNALSVKLTIAASDASNSVKMCISESSTCTNYVTYSTSSSWTFSGSLDGSTRTLYLFIKDAAGNVQTKTATYKPYSECTTKTTTTGSWGPCSKTCGGGKKSRTVTVKDSYTSKVCSTTTEKTDCNTSACCVTNKTYSVGDTVSFGGYSWVVVKNESSQLTLLMGKNQAVTYGKKGYYSKVSETILSNFKTTIKSNASNCNSVSGFIAIRLPKHSDLKDSTGTKVSNSAFKAKATSGSTLYYYWLSDNGDTSGYKKVVADSGAFTQGNACNDASLGCAQFYFRPLIVIKKG